MLEQLGGIVGLIALLSAATALIAVIVGPIVTFRIARQKIKADTVASNRQEWINTLRNELSEFIAVITSVGVFRPGGMGAQEVHRQTRIAAKIQLLLNPTEPDHQELIGVVRRAVREVHLLDDSDLEAYGQTMSGHMDPSVPIMVRHYLSSNLK